MADPIEMRKLRPEDELSFVRAIDACRNDTPSWQFAFSFDHQTSFTAYLQMLEDWTRGVGLPDSFVPNTYFVGIVNNEVVGRISIRHFLNDHLRRIGGHIGYGIVPEFRGRGYATAMLQQVLPFCARIGIDRALLTCDLDNAASRKVIEKCGGIYDGTTSEPELQVQKRRYWIDTARVPADAAIAPAHP